MTLRAVVQDGLIVVNTHGEIPDGTRVRIVVPREAKAPQRRTRSVSKRSLAAKADFGFGMWKRRTDIKDSAEYARGLRKETSRRGRNA